MTIKKAVYHTIWCDDGIACSFDKSGAAEGKSFIGVTQATAIRMAKAVGWEITAGHLARCPACVSKRKRKKNRAG